MKVRIEGTHVQASVHRHSVELNKQDTAMKDKFCVWNHNVVFLDDVFTTMSVLRVAFTSNSEKFLFRVTDAKLSGVSRKATTIFVDYLHISLCRVRASRRYDGAVNSFHVCIGFVSQPGNNCWMHFIKFT